MKNRFLLLPILALLHVGLVLGQVTNEALETAVKGQTCHEIAEALERTPLVSEANKFNGAVCFYRNGEVQRALSLFTEVRQMEAQKQHLAAFWVAKCHASLGQDSQAMATLQALPQNTLNHRMLSQEAFDKLAKEHSDFAKLKASFAPAFNSWTGLLAGIAGLGFLIGILLAFGKSRFSAGERWLAMVVFSFALILTAYVTMWTGYIYVFPYLQNTWQALTLLVGPSLFFYLKDSFIEDYSRKEIMAHYTLPIMSGILTAPVIIQDFGIKTIAPDDFFLIGSSPILLVCQLLFYTTIIFLMTKNEWQVDANIKIWTKTIAWGMVAYTAAFISYFILVRCSFFNPVWDYSISLVMGLGILAIAYMGLVQRRVFSSEPIANFLPVKKYQSSSLTPSASESIKRQMERLMQEQQVFKENELRLADLAAYLNVSYHQLSQVINEHYGVNFFELINKYRIEYVKKLMAEPKYGHYTIMQIAYEAGFNNKASFNRYFKKAIGMTPSAYRLKEGSEFNAA
jgi:AraC-like DNA-binding protein